MDTTPQAQTVTQTFFRHNPWAPNTCPMPDWDTYYTVRDLNRPGTVLPLPGEPVQVVRYAYVPEQTPLYRVWASDGETSGWYYSDDTFEPESEPNPI
jgi:hypothetical protein